MSRDILAVGSAQIIDRMTGSAALVYAKVKGSSSFQYERAVGSACLIFKSFQQEVTSVLKVINTNTTHDLCPGSWTKIPVMGSASITTGDAATDFTVEANGEDVTCNFDGHVMVSSLIYGSAGMPGAQYKIRILKNAAEDREVYLGQNSFGQGVVGIVPRVPIAVSNGDTLSLQSMDNGNGQSITIGDSFVTFERLA